MANPIRIKIHPRAKDGVREAVDKVAAAHGDKVNVQTGSSGVPRGGVKVGTTKNKGPVTAVQLETLLLKHSNSAEAVLTSSYDSKKRQKENNERKKLENKVHELERRLDHQEKAVSSVQEEMSSVSSKLDQMIKMMASNQTSGSGHEKTDGRIDDVFDQADLEEPEL